MSIDINYESKIQKKFGHKLIVGIDEVGRGPLAGPVTAGAFIFKSKLDKGLASNLRLLKDSKLLSPKQREELYEYFCELKREGVVDFSTASVFARTIDKKKIHNAAALAMQRAVKKLNTKPDYALIDGFKYHSPILKEINYSSFPKADNLVPSVAAASVVAKVTRDKSMKRYHRKYPEYRFDLHKGYGTELHYKMLKKYGTSPIHRQSFRLS